MQAPSINPNIVGSLRPYDYLLDHLQLEDPYLWQEAKLAMAEVFGHPMSAVRSDDKLSEFLDGLLKDVMLRFVVVWAAPVLALMLTISPDVGRLSENLLREAEKLMPSLFGEEMAATIGEHEEALWFFFIATFALTAFVCHSNKETSTLLKVKKDFLGRWKKV